jgi:hypothetical protein
VPMASVGWSLLFVGTSERRCRVVVFSVTTKSRPSNAHTTRGSPEWSTVVHAKARRQLLGGATTVSLFQRVPTRSPSAELQDFTLNVSHRVSYLNVEQEVKGPIDPDLYGGRGLSWGRPTLSSAVAAFREIAALFRRECCFSSSANLRSVKAPRGIAAALFTVEESGTYRSLNPRGRNRVGSDSEA